MARLFNLARMNTATTGTGAITLGSAVAGYLSFAAAGITDGQLISYGIKDGSSSEVGRGTYSTSGTQLTRSVLRSTNSNNPINLSGSAEVYITALAEDFSEWGKDHDANGFNLQFDNNTGIKDDSSNEQLIFGKTASAVNNFRMTNAATGNAPALSAEGDDTNIDVLLTPKGTGVVKGQGSVPLIAGGKHTIPWMASGMTPRATDGAAPGSTELATNDIALRTLDFDQTTEEGAGFFVPMPKSWNAGTVTFQPIWTTAGGTGGVVWSLAGRALNDDDAIDAAVGTAQTSTDTRLANNDMHIGPESSAITVAGTPAAGSPVYFEIKRVVANGSDTLTSDAKLIGIKLFITINAATDA